MSHPRSETTGGPVTAVESVPWKAEAACMAPMGAAASPERQGGASHMGMRMHLGPGTPA